ncbi:3827_t:CDS:1 [Acaulospora morrowiae]|uniref:3827_t:CDS:1 n=1 Tax=Acaulospora morrowiae TaxID=94023 RepID=A0A9N8VPW4_9GLOM|nr:3827_t:CDS:1 [Acaulospora morrowiae]
MNESKLLLLMCIALCSSFLGLLVFVEIEQWSQYKEYDDVPVIEIPSPPVDEPKVNIPYDTASLIASAVSAMTKSLVVTYYDYLGRDQADVRVYEQLDFNAFYKSRLVGGPVATHVENNSSSIPSSPYEVIVHTLTNQELLITEINTRSTVYELKRKIRDAKGVALRLQQLIFNGRKLLNDECLGSYDIKAGSIIYLEIHSQDDFETIKFINADFTNFERHIYFNKEFRSNGLTVMRDKVNKELCGWRKISLELPHAQNDSDIIDNLNEGQEVEIHDSKGKRKWKISYHGTENFHHHSIADDGYLASRKYRFNFDQGIYTTPDIKVASSYAKIFTHNGAKFQILFQNLVDSETLVESKIHNNKYWISPSENDVTLYGILIRKVDACRLLR